MILLTEIIAVILFSAAAIWAAVLAFAGLYSQDTVSPEKITFKEAAIPTAAILALRGCIITLLLLATKTPFTSFAAWDGHHYMFLAENSYVSAGTGVEFIVFYPLYPLIITLFNIFFDNSFISGFLVSNLCFSAALFLLYRLCRFDMNKKDSVYVLLLFGLSPFSFFFSGVYTESLFVMLMLLFFIALRKNRFVTSAIFAFLAALTRVYGIILFIPLFYELFRNDKKKLFLSAAPGLGFFTYLLINRIVLGNFFAFSHYQREIWYQEFSFFGRNIANYMSYILSRSELTLPIMLPQVILFFISVLLMLVALKKNENTGYILFSLAYIFVTFSASWLLSGGRYLSALFPLEIFTAKAIKNTFSRIIILSASILMMILYLALYLSGNQVM